jgi:general secretion pathway protein D
MRRWLRPMAVSLLLGLLAAPVLGDSAGTFYKKGRDAEARQKYEEAYEFYKQAYDAKPTDLRYRAGYERLRFLAGAAHVHHAQQLRDAGKLAEALAEFQQAAEIDSSSFIAQQEIRRTQKMMDAAASGTPPQAAVNPSAGQLRRRLDEAAGPLELAPIASTPVTLKSTEDTKVIYETVGKLAGINVLFDPDYTSRRIKIELNSVTLEDALAIIALESKTFWRAVTPNTIFVAPDNPSKRKEVETNVIKTFYLSNVATPTELQDLVNAMRQILEIPRIQQLPSQNAIVVRGTPDQVALAEKLISDIDKAKPEVIVEVAIMQVSRDKIRNLGVNPPTSVQVQLQPNVTTTATSTSTTGTTTGTGTTASSNTGGINLNSLAHLNATDFQVTIPQASVQAMFSDGNTKLIQNPQIRALDGQKASLKIGDRVPVATGSFQPGIGGVGINPLVNTQFQYLDVGVNIDITPHVHAGREVTLKLMMDVSAVTGNNNIGGISQPVIGQRKIESEIRLREGEVNLLGGIFENSDVKAVSGLPGLSQIPLLKYLFSSTNIEHKENEIVFVLIPHIVRGQELSDLNERTIEVGTGNAISLRHANRPAALVLPPPSAPAVMPQAAPAATPPPATAPIATPQMQSPPPAATTVPDAAAAGSAGSSPTPASPAPVPTPLTGTAFMMDPPTVNVAPGGTFAMNVLITGAQNVYSVPVQLTFDPKTLQVVNISNGGFLSQDGQAVAIVHREDATTGTIQVNATRPPGSPGVTGQGTVFTLTFMAKASGRSMLTITQGGAFDPGMQSIPVSPAQAAITIQ